MCADILDCTLATACYDLSKYASNARSIEESIEAFDTLFRVPIYLVIYCNKTLEDKIREARQKYNLDKLTLIVVKELEDIGCSDLLEKITRNSKIRPYTCHRTFPERILLLYNKFNFVKQTIINNPFKTSKFGWIDSALCKDGLKICEGNFENLLMYNLKHAPNKFHLQILNVQDKKFKLDSFKEEYYSQARWVVVGCFFTTPAEIGIKILNRLEDIVNHTVNLGFGGGEEAIYLEVLDEFYDDIYRAYGDYQQTLHNYIKPVKNLVYIYWQIVMKYYNFGYYRECIDACYSIISSFDDFQTEQNFYMYVRIYSVLYLSLLHTNKNQADLVADTIRQYYNRNPLFKQNFDNLRYLICMQDFVL